MFAVVIAIAVVRAEVAVAAVDGERCRQIGGGAGEDTDLEIKRVNRVVGWVSASSLA